MISSRLNLGTKEVIQKLSKDFLIIGGQIHFSKVGTNLSICALSFFFYNSTTIKRKCAPDLTQKRISIFRSTASAQSHADCVTKEVDIFRFLYSSSINFKSMCINER
ncbi:hypothetical protein SAMN05428947_114161 [Mucilaginibacter sp. OK283]|jgi:hypothetical protein|nr:hypothetical protein SAMN05428947_114161 [Mucilaginibacter sp. OK283]